MKKGEKSDTVGGAGNGKATAEKKGKRSSHRTRIGINFDPRPPSSGIRRRWINIW